MTALVTQQAEAVRNQAIAKLLHNEKIQERTRDGIRKISAACEKIVGEKGTLTISNVVRAMDMMFRGDHPAEQSIRNKSSAGACYRETVGIWRTFQLASGRAKKIDLPAERVEDFPDHLLSRIQPESARIHILAMRTALRNMRGRYQMLHSITPAKLIRHEGPIGATKEPSKYPELTVSELEALAAFINPAEVATRGLAWDGIGRLVDRDGRPVSRPGLFECLQKLDLWTTEHCRNR